MQDFWLLLSILAIFIFGWFLMKKLDAFLDENQKVQETYPDKDGHVLKIGFVNPLVADSISDVLEQYSRQYPEYFIRLFYGDAKDLLKKAALYKLDIIFLPEQVDIPSDKGYNKKKVLLESNPVLMKYGGLPIEPIVDGNVLQNIIWIEENEVPAVKCFIKYMENWRGSDGIAKTESG